MSSRMEHLNYLTTEETILREERDLDVTIVYRIVKH